MDILAFIGIVFGSLFVVAFAFQVFKNRRLTKSLQNSISMQERQAFGPVPGLSQEVWNKISEKVMYSSDDYLLMFDKDLKLRMWNISAKSLYEFEAGISLEELSEALEIESKTDFQEFLREVKHSPKAVKDKLNLSWKTAGEVEHNSFPVVNKNQTLEGFAISGKKIPKSITKSNTLETVDQLVSTVESPVVELKLLNTNMVDAINTEPVNMNSIQEIRNQQESLIDAVQNVISFYKKEGAKINFSEETKAVSVNSLVRSLSLVLETVDLPIQLKVDKQIQNKDCYCLIQLSNFQRLVSNFMEEVLRNSSNPRANAELTIYWEMAAMEVTINFCLGLSQLGHGLGATWAMKIVSNKNMFIGFQSHFAGVSSGLSDFKAQGEKLCFHLTLPRDIS